MHEVVVEDNQASGLLTGLSLTVANGSVSTSYVTCTMTEDGNVLSTNAR